MINDSQNDYGVYGGQPEIDSDVNEDARREKLLDDSFEAWYQSLGEQERKKLELTNVPEENVFEAAVEVEEDPAE